MVDYGMQLKDEGKTVDEIVEALEELNQEYQLTLQLTILKIYTKVDDLQRCKQVFGNFCKA